MMNVCLFVDYRVEEYVWCLLFQLYKGDPEFNASVPDTES